MKARFFSKHNQDDSYELKEISAISIEDVPVELFAHHIFPLLDRHSLANFSRASAGANSLFEKYQIASEFPKIADMKYVLSLISSIEALSEEIHLKKNKLNEDELSLKRNQFNCKVNELAVYLKDKPLFNKLYTNWHQAGAIKSSEFVSALEDSAMLASNGIKLHSSAIFGFMAYPSIDILRIISPNIANQVVGHFITGIQQCINKGELISKGKLERQEFMEDYFKETAGELMRGYLDQYGKNNKI